MKKLAVILISVMLAVSGIAFAEPQDGDVPEVKEEKAPETWCPATRYTDNAKCSECHTMVMENGKPKFGLKEIPLDASHSDKPYGMDVVREHGELVAYMIVGAINAVQFRGVSQYLYTHPEFTKLVVEIHSGGGSVMDAWRIVGIIEEMRSHGIAVETRCYGMALSAGGIIFIAGDIGKRFVSPHAEIMIHKVYTFSMFEVSDADSAEDKAELLRHLQKNINKLFEERTNLTSEVINEKSAYKMWWIVGKEAIEHGVADGLIGE